LAIFIAHHLPSGSVGDECRQGSENAKEKLSDYGILAWRKNPSDPSTYALP
jgi:hypothetical protein